MMHTHSPGPIRTFCHRPLAAVYQATRPDSASPPHIHPYASLNTVAICVCRAPVSYAGFSNCLSKSTIVFFLSLRV